MGSLIGTHKSIEIYISYTYTVYNMSMERIFEYKDSTLSIKFGDKHHDIYLSKELLMEYGIEEFMAILSTQLNGIFASHDLSIDEAAKMLAIHPATLRLWEKNRRIKPVRTIGNHRRYSVESINKLLDNKGTI